MLLLITVRGVRSSCDESPQTPLRVKRRFQPRQQPVERPYQVAYFVLAIGLRQSLRQVLRKLDLVHLTRQYAHGAENPPGQQVCSYRANRKQRHRCNSQQKCSLIDDVVNESQRSRSLQNTQRRIETCVWIGDRLQQRPYIYSRRQRLRHTDSFTARYPIQVRRSDRQIRIRAENMSLPVEKHKEDRANRVRVLDRRKVRHLLQQDIAHSAVAC